MHTPAIRQAMASRASPRVESMRPILSCVSSRRAVAVHLQQGQCVGVWVGARGRWRVGRRGVL